MSPWVRSLPSCCHIWKLRRPFHTFVLGKTNVQMICTHYLTRILPSFSHTCLLSSTREYSSGTPCLCSYEFSARIKHSCRVRGLTSYHTTIESFSIIQSWVYFVLNWNCFIIIISLLLLAITSCIIWPGVNWWIWFTSCWKRW